MRNSFYKIIAFVFAFIVFFSSTFYYFSINSLAVEMGIPMDEAFIEQWLFPIFSINNEWSFSQAGTNLKDAIEQHAGSDNLDYTADYNNAYAKSFGLNTLVDPFNLSDADEFYSCFFANDVNYKQFVAQHEIEDIKEFLSSEDQHDLAEVLIDENIAAGLGYDTKDAAFLNCVVNTISIGGQHILVAFDKTGEWLGSSFKNIISKVDELTDTDIINLKTELKSEYPQTGLCYSANFACTDVWNSELPGFWRHTFNFDTNVFVYSHKTSYGLHCIFPAGFTSGTSVSVNYNHGNIVDTYTHTLALRTNNPVGTFGGVVWYDSEVVTTENGGFYMDYAFSSKDDILAYLAETFPADSIDTTIPPYSIDIVDTSGVPYVVPDIEDLASPVIDIYPALELIDDLVIDIPATLEDIQDLIETIPVDIADAISQIIDDVIADAITIPDILIDEATDDPDNPDNPDNPDDPFPEVPPSIPNWIWPNMFPDLFDIKGLDIFKPIFDIVGTNYSMYDTWVLIPTILIFVLIIYIIISLL